MKAISPKDLDEKIKNGDEILLIDVRETYEHNDFNIGGELIPLNSIFENLIRIPMDKPVVVYCQKGIRSQIAIQRLEQRFGFHNLINLTGGMEAWKSEFGSDSSISHQ